MSEVRPIGLNIQNELASRKDSPEEIKKAVAEFESLFINQMLKTMRETVGKSELFSGGSGEEIYTSMLDMELSKTMAEAGGIGLGKVLLRQFTKDGDGLEDLRTTIREPFQAAVKDGAQAVQNIQQNAEPMKLPVDGRLSSRYGMRTDPFSGEARFHHGIDIAAREGAPIYPSASGKVVFSGAKAGYGNCVEVLHDNGLVTRYGHTQKNLVKQGDMVNSGTTIAYVGSTGRSTGPHLHFEVLKDGAALDPSKVFYG